MELYDTELGVSGGHLGGLGDVGGRLAVGIVGIVLRCMMGTLSGPGHPAAMLDAAEQTEGHADHQQEEDAHRDDETDLCVSQIRSHWFIVMLITELSIEPFAALTFGAVAIIVRFAVRCTTSSDTIEDGADGGDGNLLADGG